MPDSTARLGLPLILPAQAQKHVTHNEALQLLDTLVQAGVEDRSRSSPPAATPAEGQCHIVEGAGAWAGQGGRIAAFLGGGWVFLQPQAGWSVHDRAADVRLTYSAAGQWLAPSEQMQKALGLGIATSADTVNRLAVSAPATLLTHAGAGHQLKLNKAASGDTASLLYQTGWSGRAEMGLAGADNFSVKVSADGAAWISAVEISGATGLVTLSGGLSVSGPLSLPAGSLPRGALADGPALSVPGRAAGSPGGLADIAAGSDHQVLRRSGSTLGFGAVNLSQGNATTGTLPLTRGGTGGSGAAAARSNLGLGSAATAAVTASATDATSGALLKVGDSATLLSASPALRMAAGGAADAITLTSGAGLSGTPDTGLRLRFRAGAANTGPAMIALDGGAALACRTVTGMALPAGYIRTDADTVATFDGTFWVLDRQTERGSNANGEYLRLADGTQIAAAVITETSHAITTADGGQFRSSAVITVTYPAAFAANPVVVVSIRNPSGTTGLMHRVILPAATTADLSFGATASTTVATLRAAYVANGRWF